MKKNKDLSYLAIKNKKHLVLLQVITISVWVICFLILLIQKFL